MDRTAVYAGSFDPFTVGHFSIARGAYDVFDNVTIAIGVNRNKKGLFNLDERTEIIWEYFNGTDIKPRVMSFSGLLTNFCKSIAENPSIHPVLIRGLRAVSDFEAEMAIQDVNRRLAPQFRTVFIPTEARNAFVSSSVVKEIAYNTKNVMALAEYLPLSVAKRLIDKVWAES